MEYISAKTIVAKTKAPSQWFGIDYNMNIYKGCCHGCIYCDSRSDCYQIDDFDKVRAKEDALRIIRNDECRSPKAKRLWEYFVQECGKRGIVYRMQDIIHEYKKKYEITQPSLFD